MSATTTMDGKPTDQSSRVVVLHPEQEQERVTDMVGMVIFLGSWAVMFAALFFSLALIRSRSAVWPPSGVEPLPLLIPGINTALIIFSSVVLHRGMKAFQERRVNAFRNHLLVTAALGIVFLTLQAVVWTDLWHHGLRLSTGIYAAFFYMLTFFHAAHVLVGLGLLGWLVPQFMHPTGSPKRASRTKLVASFWHFVDVVWVLMFLFVYVL